MTKRITALLLSVILCLSLTGTAFAAGADDSSMSAEAGSNEVTVNLKGLTEGATYYLCSLLVKENEAAAEEDFKIVKSFNFKARSGGIFTHTFSDDTIPVLADGNVLRLRVPGADFSDGYIEYTVGEKETVTHTVTLSISGSGSIKAFTCNGTAWNDGPFEIEDGGSAEIVLIPSDDSSVTSFKVDGVETTLTNNTYTIAKVTKDIAITAVVDYTGEEPAKPGVKLNRTTVSIPAGGSAALAATVTPKDADYTIEWTVSDEDLAEAVPNSADSSKATVKLKSAAKAGDKFTVTVTATIDGVEYSASCAVTVVRKTSGGGGGGGGSSSSGYSITVGRPANGSISVSPSRAEEGKTVTITVRPQKGYELDWLTVKDGDGRTIRTTKVSDTEYTFTMPEGGVEVNAAFKAAVTEDVPASTSVSFSDVPATFWAYDQITWAANRGIMGGYGNGIFGPDRNTTRQALWMVLARLNGSSPADMAAARSWAVANGVSDGSNAGGTMSRQQMVTMLYRYAQMKGYATTGSVSLSGYPDSASVAGYAQEALSWAVANGIMGGTSDGRLNPAGTASRAHFAVFMYRFCNLYNIA